MNSARQLRSGLLLFLAALIWGIAFVSQSKGMEYMGPLTFNGVRSILGALVLTPLVMCRKMRAERQGTTLGNKKDIILGGAACGLAILVASNLQQFGILYTTVGKAGFLTALYIIIVPILGIFIGKRVGKIIWGCAMLAMIGMYFLCMNESFSLGLGDGLVFLCSVVFSIHILVIDYFSPKVDGVLLSMLQFLVCGVICLTGAFIWESPSVVQLLEGWLPIGYAGILSCGVAYTLQIVGQKDLNPTVASLILSMESVISALAGYLAFRIGFLTTDQTLTVRQIVGCVIVFVAVIAAQLPLETLVSRKDILADKQKEF